MNEKNKTFNLRLLILNKEKIEIFNPSRSVFKMFGKSKGVCKVTRLLERPLRGGSWDYYGPAFSDPIAVLL
jgi:hypothetical protein